MMNADADPKRTSTFRAALRAYETLKASGGDAACVGTEVEGLRRLRTFERILLAGGEHAGGWMGGNVRWNSWSNAVLAR